MLKQLSTATAILSLTCVVTICTTETSAKPTAHNTHNIKKTNVHPTPKLHPINQPRPTPRPHVTNHANNHPHKNQIAKAVNRLSKTLSHHAFSRTAAGLILGGSDAMDIGGVSLNPGDTILSVGGVPTADSSMSLPDLVEQAFQVDNPVVTVLDGATGRLVTIRLPID